MAQNSVDDTKLGRSNKTRSMTQNSVDDTKLKARSGEKKKEKAVPSSLTGDVDTERVV